MPTYVYACKECDARLEVFQSITAAPLTVCEKCGGSLRRVLFAPAVVYKGSGFYTTDYKNGGRKSESSSSESSASESAASPAADTKSDAKSEAKSETKTETSTSS